MSRRKKKGRAKGKVSPPEEESTTPLDGLLFGKDRTIEPWGFAAFGLFGLTLLVWGILAMRPGGATPIWLYSQGRFLLVLVGLLVGAWAFVAVLRNKPVIQSKRLWPVAALAGTIGLAPFPVPYPAPRERAPSHAQVQLPVQGTWRVRWAGEGVEHNPLVLEPARRFGVVLVREEEGTTLLPGIDPEQSASAGDYLGFGAQVQSPTDGVIAAVLESLADGPQGRAPLLGNYVVIEVASGEFLWLSGLKQDSVLPEVGDPVAAGSSLAQVGASAARRPTGEPHLGMYMASSADPALAEGIPWRLQAWREGIQERGPGMPQGGVNWDGSPRGPLIQPAD